MCAPMTTAPLAQLTATKQQCWLAPEASTLVHCPLRLSRHAPWQSHAVAVILVESAETSCVQLSSHHNIRLASHPPGLTRYLYLLLSVVRHTNLWEASSAVSEHLQHCSSSQRASCSTGDVHQVVKCATVACQSVAEHHRLSGRPLKDVGAPSSGGS